MNWQVHSKRFGFLFFVLAFLFALLGFFALFSGENAYAMQPVRQTSGNEDCSECHEKAVMLWTDSKHAGVPLNCTSCHVVLPGEGEEHPELQYSVESEEKTCATCHNDHYTQWYGGQHGDLSMSCTTCHEPHSQQQKLIGDNQTTCEACHKKQVDAGHGSTHEAAGASCVSCHIDNDSGHLFNATISTCNSCHSDIHDTNSLVLAGVDFAAQPAATEEPVATDEAAVSEGSEAGTTEAAPETPKGGVNLPSWLLLIAGLLVGGGVVWVVIGKDPGIPTEDEK